MSPGLHQAGLLPSATEIAFANLITVSGQFGGVMGVVLWGDTRDCRLIIKVCQELFSIIIDRPYPCVCPIAPEVWSGHNLPSHPQESSLEWTLCSSLG